jgi:hypothetical protein
MANLIYWLLVFSGTVALIVIIISGLRFIVSGGESKSVETAKKTMTFAVLGLLLVFLSFFILNVIAYVTNVACLSDITKGIPSFQSCGATSGGPTGGGCLTGSCESACLPSEVTVAGSCTIGGAPGACCTPRAGGL